MEIKSQASHSNYTNSPTRVVPERAASIPRETMLDIWRGLAVVLMILTHSIAFFHVGEDNFVNAVGWVGGTISFGLFLFVSGITAYLSYIKYDSHADAAKLARRRKKIILRSLALLFGYYLVAFVASFAQYSFPPNASWIENIGRTLFFIDVPQFTEFILPFVFLGLSLLLFRRLYKFLVRYPLLAIMFGIGIYVLGAILFSVQLPGVAGNIKSLFVGEQDWHRFPLFQYLVVYLFGMIWGKFMLKYSDYMKRQRAAVSLTAISAVLLALTSISFNYTAFPWLDVMNRFPPSVTFLLVGLFSGYLLLVILQLTNNLGFLGTGMTWVRFAGINAFDFFIFHTIVLFIYKYVTNDQHFSSTLILFGLYILLLIITTLLCVIKVNLIRSLKSASGEDEGFRWLFSEKLIVTILWIAIFLIGGMGILQGRVSGQSINVDAVAFHKRLIHEDEWPYWWDHNYSYFREIFISNEMGSGPIVRNTWFSFNIDHADMVSRSQSLVTGADVRVVFYDDSDGSFIELPFVFNGINTNNATIQFKLQADIPLGVKDDNYFLYYGNQTASAFPASKDSPVTVQTAGITLSDPYNHHIGVSTNRRWILKEGSVSLQMKTLLFKATLDSTLSPNSTVTYNVPGTTIRGSMDNMGSSQFQASVKVTDLQPGVYQIQAIARQPDNKLKQIPSGYSTFYVTYPLYVAWTMDWEGWDVPDDWLSGLDSMANQYGIQMTHFFNPRIYITNAVTKERAAKMTLWVNNRVQNHFDEVGMHLHMWYDMVQAAGVQPRYSPYASWLYGDGGGVPLYAYTTEETKKVLVWAKDQFQANGLSTPISFRAGGWLLGTNTLQALQQEGFLIDSSGRTAFTRNGFAVPWNLSETQRPYKPNLNDINSSAEPTFNIWEFPDNGADSYWYDSPDLIHRFDLNYPNKGGVMSQAQVLTYLSHPPFFLIDKPKMTRVFDYIKSYLYVNDNGPVLYTTLENAYYSWER